MNKNPLVAIVVLNYNGRDCLPLALRSLAAQSYEPKKIIIVDNASQDDSFGSARKYFPQGLFLQNSKNFGFAAGMNVGIREAFRLGADYVWLFNNDAETEPSALTELVRFCESRPDVGAASPLITDPQGKTWFAVGKISYLRMRAYHGKRKKRDIPYQSEYLSGCALFIPSPVLKQAGLLDERYFLYYEDADLSLRIARARKRLFVVPSARVRHGEQSEGNNPEKLYHLVYSGLLFFHDHMPKLLRSWLWGYEMLRRLKNQIDLFLGRWKALAVRRAYQDYDRNKQLS